MPDYLKRYRNNTAFWAIPNEIILEVVQYLDCQKDRSHLAQSCRKFYLVITDFIFRHNVLYNRSSLLNYAAKKNLNFMARRILQVGGDIETRRTVTSTTSDQQLTPLATAALFGHSKILRMLLEAGASQLVDESRIPLVVAIFARQESVALLLSQELHASVVPFGNTGSTVLQIASEAKLPHLVRHYLNHGESRSQRRPNDEHVHNLSSALMRILLIDFSGEDFIERKLDDKTYQIVLMLLQQGASPDVRIQTRSLHAISARVIASRHPDPRVRNLLSARMSSQVLILTRLLVGRPWMASSGDETLTSVASQSRALLSADSCSAHPLVLRALKIWRLRGMAARSADNSMWRRTSCEEIPLNASDIPEIVRRENCKPKKAKLDLHPQQLTTECSFPQLACPKTDAQSAAKEFWVKRPVMESRPIPSDVCTVTPTAKQKRLSCVELFPQIAQVCQGSNDVAKDIWACFSKHKVAHNTNEPHRAPPNEEINQATRQLHQSRKQKKWVPLLF